MIKRRHRYGVCAAALLLALLCLLPLNACTKPGVSSAENARQDLLAYYEQLGEEGLTDQTQAFVGRNLKESSVFADLYGNTWTPENPGAKYPRMTTGAIDNNNQLSTFWMANGRYLRLKNLELGYTLPKRIANKIAMQSLRVYLSGVNLFTFSPFKLWDPDLQTGATNYPNNRIINLGLTIGF